MNIILVNATAARSSGALSILNQMIDSISNENKCTYYIFIHPNNTKKIKKNLIYVEIDTVNWISRIKWDSFGVRKWCAQHNVKPSLIISLQNTGVKFDKTIPQLIYYHQLLPLSNKKWNVFLREERSFFIYKNFYSFFVKRYIHENTFFVVQIPSVRDAFVEKFKVNASRVYIIPPEIPLIDSDSLESYDLDKKCYNFIYPATPLIYKNHLIIIEALQLLRNQNPEVFEKVKMYFTFLKENHTSFYKKVCDSQLQDHFIFCGVKPYQELLSMYKSVDALLFPSYIESFGLPLIEAASLGVPIVASDLPYARDVVGHYEGTRFVDSKEPQAWCDAIRDICLHRHRFTPMTNKSRGGWGDFFILVNRLIDNNYK